MQKEAYNPTFGSTPAIIEKAIASGINASATTRPDKISPLIFPNHSSFLKYVFTTYFLVSFIFCLVDIF